ncbi:MAG: DNA-binding response regulator [Acidimicrobiia bacterium]
MRVLVIEDDTRLSRSLKRGLEAEGFAVDVAADGNEGLWMASEVDYDAIVLDILLPGSNGYKVCSELRERENWTPILMLTAKDGEQDHAEALDTGADDFLTKPFSLVVLLAHLRALIRRGRRERPTVLAVDDLHLDPAQHRCWRGNTEIALTPRQFALLEYLMRHPGEVVSKAALLDHVWDFAFDGEPNIIEVYISHLRKKIDQPFGRNTIRTVRGVGYILHPREG